ncbi:phytase [Pontibacter ruber]|uniref:Phytase n=1 Tax=Pontibacter ruber TaxID=1343895 RepID=A0ABW5D260_9BACT|nr:phytase [Pontibacter ruber]
MFVTLQLYAQKAIAPLFVTEPVKYDSDDPAIWINKQDPSASLILGTDKDEDGALYVFNMEGKIIADKVIKNLKRPNNVDVAYGLMLNGKRVDIAVTTERYAGKLRIFSVPDMQTLDNGGIEVFAGETGEGIDEPMGIALYERPTDGKVYAIVSRKSGPTDGEYLWQYLLEDDGKGSVKGTLVRKFGKYSGRQEIESVAVDDELGYIYYSDEKAGVRKYYADPEKGDNELALFASNGFASEHEGISIYKIEDGTGYILVSDQQADEFHIFTRDGTAANPHDHKLVKVVKVAAHESDGSDVANFPLLPHFPKGVFVAMSTDKTFHLYRWEDIAGNDLKIQPPVINQTPSDKTAPTVLSITRQNPTTENTSNTSVIFRATFSERVNGVDASDFVITAVTSSITGTISEGKAVGTSGTIYDVTVSSITGTGTLRLDLKNTGTSITDTSGNNISGGYTSGQTYTIVGADQTKPIVVSINRQSPTEETNGNTSVIYRTTFSEKVNGVDATDFTLTSVSGNAGGTVASIQSVGTAGDLYDVAISSISGSGTLRLDLKSSGTNITDVSGNAIAGGFTTGQTYTIEPAPSNLQQLVTFQSSWRYQDDGSDQGNAWQATDFNDSGWKTGNGKFGYGITTAATTISYGGNPDQKYITTYFRKTITIPDSAAYTSYTAKVESNNGVLVYLNGTEVFRQNMPVGTASYTTLATTHSGGTAPVVFTIPDTAFKTGINTIAVEVHQSNPSNAELAFDLELAATPADPITSAVEEIGLSSDIKVYPNPFTTEATISFTFEKNESFSVAVYDSKGLQVTETIQGKSLAGEPSKIELDGQVLASGLYIVKLETKRGIRSVPLLLNK